jgi:hypothetical protein
MVSDASTESAHASRDNVLLLCGGRAGADVVVGVDAVGDAAVDTPAAEAQPTATNVLSGNSHARAMEEFTKKVDGRITAAPG